MEISTGITNISEIEERVSARNESTVAEINKYFDNLAKMLDFRKNELIEKATLMKDSKHKQLQVEREQLEITMASCATNIEFGEQALKNGNNIQILNMKKYISQSLENLKNKENHFCRAVDDHIRFIADFSVNDLDNRVVLLCCVADEKESTHKYTACFNESEKWLKVGVIYKITIKRETCKTSDESQRGLGTIKVVFQGVTVKEVTLSADNHGSYDVSFIAVEVGVLKFAAYINGRPAPSCTLSRGVKLMLHSECIDKMVHTTWFGECILESGIHTWKITINHADCSLDERVDLLVGVINYDDHERKCTFGGYTHDDATQIWLKLDMYEKKLTVIPSWMGKCFEYEVTFPRASPYFTTDCDECYVHMAEMGPFSFEEFQS